MSFTISGKYNSALVHCDDLDEASLKQIHNILNNPGFAGGNIVIMPDVHCGVGSVIGFTMKMKDAVCPNVVGVDIGCGIDAYNLGNIQIDFEELDRFIRYNVPSGTNTHRTIKKDYFEPAKELIKLIRKIDRKNEDRFLKSIGTLGGGNHFIEISKNDRGDKWLLIHSGSRNFGLRLCNYHQKKAKEYIRNKYSGFEFGNLEYMPLDKGGNEYLEDMRITQEYAVINRSVMANIILDGFFKIDNKRCERVSSIHNYICLRDNIIRKGAISAYSDERVIIPFNMRDGSIIGKGKGNKDWNFSAPHGAGRILSRIQAKKVLNMKEFKDTMKGVFTTCISNSTLDEAPMAYRSPDEILKVIGETVDIEFTLKPIYNFKAN